MSNKPITYNKFHEFFNQTIARRGFTSVEVAERLSDGEENYSRQFPWQASYKPTFVLLSRVKYLDRLAHLLLEPLSKLVFLIGMNPWADRLELNEQIILWQLCERVVKCKEDGTKPNIAIFNTFVRDLFGGLTVEDNDKFIEMVKNGQTETNEEDLGDTP